MQMIRCAECEQPSAVMTQVGMTFAADGSPDIACVCNLCMLDAH